ncbi:DUF1499 domain-containing protein [Myxococcota bacterium]|nr:DUF1499 domain-containing protein [Myxococcota bacterium]
MVKIQATILEPTVGILAQLDEVRGKSACRRFGGTFANLLACWMMLGVLGCASPLTPPTGGLGNGLAPCPDTPNCVSSEASDVQHAVAPLVIRGNPEVAWQVTREVVGALPRVIVVAEGQGWLRAECRSALFRFVDDLDLRVYADRGVIEVRSASRVGYGDLGVNRRRVENLRAELALRGVVEPG